MIAEVTRRYQIECMHRLTRVPEGHKCARVHGHTYQIDVTVDGPVCEDGFVIDFYALDELVRRVLDGVDHQPLNDCEALDARTRANPTTELLAAWLWHELEGLLPFCDAPIRLASIAISENPQSVVTYRGA